MRNDSDRTSIVRAILWLVVVASAALALLLFSVFTGKQEAVPAAEEAKAHYCFVADNIHDRQWDLLYEATRLYGADEQIYVECMNRDFPEEYTKEDLMRIAVLSRPDGIFVEGGDSDVLREQIEEATARGIHVITLEQDCTESGRDCFIETGNFNLGREYARQIIRVATKDTKSVLVVTEEKQSESSRPLLDGISQTLQNEGNHLDLDVRMETVSGEAFTSAQLIRRRVLSVESKPDIIICCSDRDTINAHQVLADYNLADEIKLIGASTSDTILRGIENGTVYASIVTDTSEMGKRCIRTMNSLLAGESGTDHYTLDAASIRKNNVRRYLNDE